MNCKSEMRRQTNATFTAAELDRVPKGAVCADRKWSRSLNITLVNHKSKDFRNANYKVTYRNICKLFVSKRTMLLINEYIYIDVYVYIYNQSQNYFPGRASHFFCKQLS